ncbi:MAG: sulfate/thiosulfate transport system substrate-binding protein [Acidobacteriota bacterium]|nr:sulfate/thiosulfate transport system substrate-binding protein [Acidobacteriota bacterium]
MKRTRLLSRRLAPLLTACLALVVLSSCLPQSPTEHGDAGTAQITVYGFSIMKEAFEKAIYPAFAAKWKQEHGQDVKFVSSFAGSETLTNQILQGAPAHVAILSIERDAARLRQGGAITSDWHDLPQHGIVNKTPFVIIVRKGNPKNIRDFADLGKPGVKVIHPDPVSSGGAQWSVLAIYGSELVKSEKASGGKDEARALATLQAVWRNVVSTPGSAREARTQFETGYGDALITYELEGLLMKQANAPVEVVVPEATIFSEHPAVIIDRNVRAVDRPVVEGFLQYLWSEEAQRAFVQYHLHSTTDEQLNDASKEFAHINQPFTVDYFGGWDKAYPEVIEKIFRDQVQKRKQ